MQVQGHIVAVSCAGLALFLLACGEVTSNIDASTGDGKSSDGPSACPIGASAMCVGNQIATCDGQGNITAMSDCALGCNAAANRCNKVDPSNGLATVFDDAANAPDVTLVGAATINTDMATITDQSGARVLPTATMSATPVDIFIIKVKSLTTGGNVTVTGSRALAIVSAGDVSIGHVVSVSANLSTPGPGAVASDANCRGGNAAADNAEGKAGGGGGGFGTAGGQGGSGGVPAVTVGAAGGTAGTPELKPLRGGCPGGRASGPSGSHAAGAGGGALQIVSATAIRLTAGGALAANGGAGHKTSGLGILCAVDTPCGNGEGAGSGGAILLEAPVVEIAASSGVFANGGGGTCDLNGAGTNGQNSTTPAAGQTCGGQTGNGGNGAAGASGNGANGGNKTGNDSVGGGGGGGLGRIRINLPVGVTFSAAGSTSGVLSVGALATR